MKFIPGLATLVVFLIMGSMSAGLSWYFINETRDSKPAQGLFEIRATIENDGVECAAVNIWSYVFRGEERFYNPNGPVYVEANRNGVVKAVLKEGDYRIHSICGTPYSKSLGRSGEFNIDHQGTVSQVSWLK